MSSWAPGKHLARLNKSWPPCWPLHLSVPMKRNSKQNEPKQTQLFLVLHDSKMLGDGRLVCQPFVLSVFFCYHTIRGNLPSRALNLSSGLDLAQFWLRSGIPEVSRWLGFIPLFQSRWSNRTNSLGCWVMWWVLPAGFKHTQKYVNKFTSLLNCCAGIFAMGEKKGVKKEERSLSVPWNECELICGSMDPWFMLHWAQAPLSGAATFVIIWESHIWISAWKCSYEIEAAP